MTKFLRSLGSSLPLLALLCTLSAGQARAQVDNYVFTKSTGTFQALSAIATAVPTILADDAVGTPITLPFAFNFDGTPYNSVTPSSNGILSFNAAVGTAFDNAGSGLSTAPATYRPFVAPYFDDLDGRVTGATARYQTSGAAPNRVFTFQWLNWGRYAAPANTTPFLSFQVKLYEGTNVVQFIYRDETATTTLLSASIGLAGAGTGAGSYLSLSDASSTPTASSTTDANAISTIPATGQIYIFTPAPLVGCPAPRSLSISDVTGTGATLNFRGNLNATTYTIIVTPAGGTALAPITATSSPQVLTGLSPNTTYLVTIVSNCSGGVTSTAGTLTFVTTGPYCQGTAGAPLGGTCGGNDVNSVTIAGTTLNAQGLTCTTSGSSAYTNYPATPPTTATLNGGVPYQISVKSNGASIISAWLDSNHNLIFEPSEWVQVAVSSTAGTISTATIYVPITAVLGETGLRVRSRAAGNINGAPDACTQFFSGETKDFTVTIGAPANCPTVSDAAAGAITTTGATVTFTPLTAAGGYTLTVTPQGGAALPPITATTSPVALTGLQPNTNYTVSIVSNCGGTNGNSIGAVLAFTTLPVPPANDNCAGAITVPVTANCTSPTTGTVLAASQSQPPTASCGTAGTANDVWYSFTATGVNHVLNVTGQFAGVVEVRSGTCAASSSIFCTTFTAGGTGISTIVGSLTIGQVYFIRLYANSVPAQSVSGFTVCVTPGPTPPSNDNCATATPLPVSATCATPTAGTVAAASQSLPPTANCGFGITQANDVWYSFVANGTSQALTFAPQFNGVVDVRSGTCATSASIYCNTATGGAQLIASVTGLTSGQTYFLRVYASTVTNPAGASAGFTLCLTAGSAAPANDDCAGALDVPVQLTCTSPTTSTNVGAGASTGVPAPTCRPNGYAGGDIWFRVTVPTNGTVTVGTVAPSGGSAVVDTQMSVYSGACGSLSEINCNDEGPGQVGYSQLTINGRTPGEILYVRVWAYGNSTSGPIAMCATTPNAAPCPGPTNLVISNIGSTTATLDFSPSSAATTYSVSVLAQGSTTPIVVTPVPTTAPVQLTGLAPGVAYTVSITSNCAGGINSATSKITFATVTPCPAPATLVFNNVTATTVRLSFASTGAVSYTLTLTPTTGAPRTLTVTSSPVDLTGLTPGTTYAVTLVAVCGPGRTSPAATSTLTTLASYCDTGLGGVCGTNDIVAVSFTATTLNTSALTCTTVAGQAYTAYPVGGNTTANLLPGTTYALNVTTATPSIVGAWIDYNHNLTYEASEYTLVATATTANQPATVSIIIPATPPSVLGLTNMRIRSRAVATQNGPADACTNFGASGETKDFTVTIGPPAPCPVATGLAFNNVTATTATFNFTPAATATSYLLTLTPTSGPPITLTVSGSPVNLTTLVPNSVYAVQLVTNCGGGRTSSPATSTVTTLVSSSRAQFESAALLLYPNPVNAGQFTLRLNGNTGQATATLFDMLGRALLTQSLTGSKEHTVDVHQLAIGVYILRLQTADGQTLTRKVVLE